MQFDFVWPIVVAYFLLSASGFAELLIRQVWVKQLSLLFSSVLLITLAGLRAVGVGSDDEAYALMFRNIPALIDCSDITCNYNYAQFNIEAGFFALLSFLHSFSDSHYLLFLVIALCAVFLNIRAIIFFIPSAGAGVLIYFCHFYLNKELNAIRLGLASAILFWAATYIPARQYWAVCFLVVLASFVHVSSLLFLLPFIVYCYRPGRWVYAIFGVVTLLFAGLVNIHSLFSYLVGFGFVGEKIGAYLSADVYNYSLPLVSAVNLKNFLFVGLGLVFWKRLSKKFIHFELVYCFFYCAAVIRVLLGGFAIVAGRGYAAIAMFEYALIPFVIFSLCGKWLGYFLVVLYAGLTFYLNLTDNSGWSGGALRYFDF